MVVRAKHMGGRTKPSPPTDRRKASGKTVLTTRIVYITRGFALVLWTATSRRSGRTVRWGRSSTTTRRSSAGDLHEELTEPSVASIFAYFFRLLEVVVKARKIPATPARGVRVSSGEYEAGLQVVIPVQFLRAVLRLQESFGQVGFVLVLMNGYTGARWSELVALRPHDHFFSAPQGWSAAAG